MIINDLLARGIALADLLLGDRFANVVSVRLMEHASRTPSCSFRYT